jgi:peptide/nickel transport system permease protein
MWMVRLVWLSPMMLRFILRRLVHMIPIVIIVIAIGFGLIQLAPGDIFTQMALNPNVRPGDLDTLRSNFGLDRPWYVQFLLYIWNAVRGDFGFSENFKAPVFTLVQQYAANTILLSLTSLLLAWGFSIPAGVFAATHQYKWQDQTISVLAFIGLAIPNFFLAFLLIYLVSNTGLPLPIGGMSSIDSGQMGAIGRTLDVMRHMIIPVVVLGTAAMASLTRIMRANMLEVMNQQYIVTARAKGQEERKVVYRHALRNAINPMITILGFHLGNIMSGAALVENVVAWPGLGRLILQALLTQDTYLVVGSLIYGVVLLVIGNLIADILLAVVDPRVRIG